MTQAALQAKLEQAINEIIDEAVNRTSLTPEVRRQMETGVRREASKKAQRIFEYLEQYINNRISSLEGRVTDLENRVTTLGSAGPTSGTGTL